MFDTHNEVSNDHGEKEERNAVETGTVYAVPHGLDPLAAQHTEHDHERVKEVDEVPARYFARKVLLCVVYSEHLPIYQNVMIDDRDNDRSRQVHNDSSSQLRCYCRIYRSNTHSLRSTKRLFTWCIFRFDGSDVFTYTRRGRLLQHESFWGVNKCGYHRSLGIPLATSCLQICFLMSHVVRLRGCEVVTTNKV